ncbi:hypothetical protein MD484_g9007, partial [Candolleomyces efflorescens]
MKRLLEDSDSLNLIPHLRHMAGDTILSIAYGIRIQGLSDSYLQAAEASFQYVPAWFPGASFQRKAHEARELAGRVLELPYAEGKKVFEIGSNTTASLVSACLQKAEEGKEDDTFTEETIKGSAGTLFAGKGYYFVPATTTGDHDYLYEAGSDTTVSAIASCILGFLERPDVLRKAQAQLDSVVDHGCLPELEHESSLPYITAIVYETLRWRDVIPMAVPHLLSAEDIYNGYRFPKGAVIIPNSWAMLHDETVYSDPFTFNPDRFINPESGQVDFKSAPDPSMACWGFGRRVCPGRHVALTAIWLAIASLASVFDFEKAKEKVKVVGEDGVEREEEKTIELTHDYISTLAM